MFPEYGIPFSPLIGSQSRWIQFWLAVWRKLSVGHFRDEPKTTNGIYKNVSALPRVRSGGYSVDWRVRTERKVHLFSLVLIYRVVSALWERSVSLVFTYGLVPIFASGCNRPPGDGRRRDRTGTFSGCIHFTRNSFATSLEITPTTYETVVGDKKRDRTMRRRYISYVLANVGHVLSARSGSGCHESLCVDLIL